MFDLFLRTTAEREFQRGKQNALEFLAGHPTQSQIESYYACAEDELSLADSYYAKGVQSVIYPRVGDGNVQCH